MTRPDRSAAAPTATAPSSPPAPRQMPRVLPHSPEAEQTVLGGIVLFSQAFTSVADILVPEDFYHPAHVSIYAAMVELDAAGRPIDSITIAERMRENDSFHRLRAMNGESYFAELTSAVVTVENIAYHARIVHGKAVVRRMIERAQEIAAKGYGEYGDVDEYLSQAQESILQLGVGGGGRLVTFEESCRDAYRSVERAYDRRVSSGGVVTGVPSGFRDIDRLTGGWQDEYVILAARPSMGKSSLMMDTVAAAAWQGFPCLVFSREMTHQALTLREIAKVGGVDGWRARTGNMRDDDWKNLSGGANRIHSLPIWYDDTTSDLRGILSVARRWRSDRTLGGRLDMAGEQMRALVVLDYLQLVEHKGARKYGTKEAEIAEISRAFRDLPKLLRCPVIVLSQLNRELEKRPNKRPIMADLRDSGSLEQDADVIAFIYRDEVYNPETKDKGVAEINFAKSRNGKTGMVRLGWQKEITRFYDLPEEEEVAA